MISELMRRTVFWTIDRLQGGVISDCYKDIEHKMSQSYDVDACITDIMEYAKNHVKFYMGKGYATLAEFPIINKKTIMSDYIDFRSTEYPDEAVLHKVETSGSSGNPFHAYEDAYKRKRVIAETLYTLEINGWHLGDRYAFLRAWTEQYNCTKLQRIKQNFICFNTVGFDVCAMEKMRIALITDKTIQTVIGYASSLTDLAEYMLQKGDNSAMFRMKLIVADSDTLTQTGRKSLERLFGCNVVDRYSNEEQGVIAYRPSGTDEYIINSSNYYLEILKMDADVPAGEGEIGRIVITDLYNHAMPFIRYDTGDLAIGGQKENGLYRSMKSFQGRISDCIYQTNGTAIYSPTINNYICDFESIKQYQLVQEDKTLYRILVVSQRNCQIEDKVFDGLKKLLGENCVLEVCKVDSIPKQKNGKFRTVISHYKPNHIC